MQKTGPALAGLLARVFKPAARYPADPRAVFLLALSVFTGVAALAIDAAPKTLNSVLPGWGTLVWGGILVVGSAIALLGMARQTAGGIILEQIGSVMVGAASVFYAVLATKIGGKDVIQPVGIVLAWGVSCFVRWGQLQALVNQAVIDKLKAEVARELEERLHRGD